MSVKNDLLILGSQNSKEADQELTRDQIYPVQILDRNGVIKPVKFFQDWGEVGVSSIAWHPNIENYLFVSINTEIRKVNVNTGHYTSMNIPKIADLHDINFLEDTLWISNTEFDEAIEYDVRSDKVVQRISLSEYRTDAEVEQSEEIKDQFHCNQILETIMETYVY